MINLTINNQKVEVEEGSTILEAAQRMGIKIPTLCLHKALVPYGACRLCLVEVALGGNSAKIHASCTHPALEGLIVRTDTERVLKIRKIIAELLLARCPDVQAIQEIANELDVQEVRFKKKDSDCILCGLCVRMCEERMGRSAIGFTGRGFRRKVEPPFGEHNELCWTCKACDFVCPTGKKISGLSSINPPRPILSEFNQGLEERPSIYILYPQMVPNKPMIDKNSCVHLQYNKCGICKEVCEADAINYNDVDKRIEIDVGAVLLSPGYEVFDAGEAGEFGYGRYPNVITSLQFERVLSASGPFGGRVVRPYDGSLPKRMAFIQCVGSRDIDRPYCSSVCCMYATKEALIAREHNPDISCKIFYRDIRAFGKGYESYYERAKKEGIEYIKASPSTVKQDPKTRNLKIQYKIDGKLVEEEFELVILCVGISSIKIKALSEKLGLKTNEFGFVDTPDFEGVESSIEDVFVAGVATGPKDIPESVMEASAAVSKCMALLHDVKGQLMRRKEYPSERDISKEEPKVGVFVCHCGTNIAGVVNVPEVVEYVQTLPGVVYVENNLYTCSADTCERIKTIIKEQGLNRVVVASCTPRTHEGLFMDTLKEAGLNPYLFEMANIRDQCSWVHMHEPQSATKKAKDLVRMAVTKVKANESLYPKFVKVTKSALVIGGGMAGMTSALQIARQDLDVHLVEKTGELGGFAKKIKYLLDGDIKERLDTLIASVEKNPKIHLHLNSEVVSVNGSVGNLETVIKSGVEEKVIKHGVAIVATGAKEYKPEGYLYGKSKSILTQTELEDRIVHGGVKEKEIVMIQCVGSRESPRDYCSRVCCSTAIKNAIRIKEDSPNANIYILHRDIRTYGFYEKFYRKAREMGVRFVRFDGEKPSVSFEDGRLNVSVKDVLLMNMKIDLPAGIVVLSSATQANETNKDLAQKLKVPLTQDGFFLEAHMKLRPVDFATDGMFVCGTAHGPKNIFETIIQAMAVASRAGVLLSKDEIEIEPRICEVIDENCDGCAYCIDPCPYSAITLLEYVKDGSVKKTVKVDIAKCHGCGTCMATCPKKGIYVKNFRLEQLGSVVESALVKE